MHETGEMIGVPPLICANQLYKITSMFACFGKTLSKSQSMLLVTAIAILSISSIYLDFHRTLCAHQESTRPDGGCTHL